MEQNRKKDIHIFIAALGVIAVTFAGGVAFLKHTGAENTSGLLADVSNTVQSGKTPTPVVTATTTAEATNLAVASATTITTSTKPASTTKSATTVAAKETTSTKPTATSTAKSASVTTSTVAVQPASKPVATPPPAPAPASTPPTASPALVALSIPYSENNFTGDKNWQQTWGSFSVDSSGYMDIGATTSTTGGGVTLAGSSAWTDYVFTATVDWIQGETFTLVAHNDGNGNSVQCTFDNEGDINIYRVWTGGNQQLIGQGTAPGFSMSGDLQAFIEVDGSHVHCGIGSGTASNNIAPQLTSGSIGFDTWDPNTDNSEVIVKSVSVTSAYQDSY